MIQILLEKLYNGHTLTEEESFLFFSHVMSGEIAETLLATALISMKIRGECVDEITGAALASLSKAVSFDAPDYDFADIVGTGGDGANSINISTASTFVAAACGFPIAKHGNRGVSSRSGASDVLSSFGVNLHASAETSRHLLDTLGVCFLFAQSYHQGFKYAANVRQQLKTRTIFNLLGPLINPSRPKYALIGVYNQELLLPMASVLKRLGYKNAVVVHCEGLDEVSLHGKTLVAELMKGEEISCYELTPQEFGLSEISKSDLVGGSPDENRLMIAEILQGKGKPAHESVVAANVALLMRVFGHRSLKDNVAYVMDTIKTGKPYSLIEAMVARG